MAMQSVGTVFMRLYAGWAAGGLHACVVWNIMCAKERMDVTTISGWRARARALTLEAREFQNKRQFRARLSVFLAQSSVQEASETCPKRVRIGSERRPCRNRARELKKSGETARDVPTFSARTGKLPSVFDDFAEQWFSCTGAIVFTDFAKPPRLCRKFKTATPVQKIEH